MILASRFDGITAMGYYRHNTFFTKSLWIAPKHETHPFMKSFQMQYMFWVIYFGPRITIWYLVLSPEP